jgi:oxygen-independent coproporphyrinogen III oxidase
MAGIYIHIPFCKQACYYCDFHFSTNQEVRKSLVECIKDELIIQKWYLKNEMVNTIYFGGGTPSLLEEDELELILDTIRNHFELNTTIEITLEANPDDLSEHNLTYFKKLGINRLSIGIQSFHNPFLSFLHRTHSAEKAIEGIKNARKTGFNNISIDLIYAIPGETNEQWLDDIDQALALNPEHISCYSLTIEEKTVFGKWAAAGKLKVVNDDNAAQHLELLMEKLEANGYEHYEISNFAKPGFHSQHNSSYWNSEFYLGVGPSAHSYNGTTRQFNISNNHLYIKSIQQQQIPFEQETLSREDKINEYLLISLRTAKGANLLKLKTEYACDLLEKENAYIQTLLAKNLALLENNMLRLTKKGKLVADKIASDLFILPV